MLRLQREVEALHVAAPLLDREAEDDNQPTLQRAVNDVPQKNRAPVWEDRAESTD
jgi:hypothetical protein